MGHTRVERVEMLPDARGTGSRLSLTAFENRILSLLAQGCDRHQIAQMVNRSPKTVSNVLTTARDKLGARTLPEAVALFIEA